MCAQFSSQGWKSRLRKRNNRDAVQDADDCLIFSLIENILNHAVLPIQQTPNEIYFIPVVPSMQQASIE